MSDPALTALARPGTVLLDSARPDADTGSRGALLFERPVREIAARTLAEVGPALDALDAALAEGLHVAGMLAYEAGAALVPGLTPTATDPSVPLLWFGVYGAPEVLTADRLDAALGTLARGAGPRPVRDLTFALGREAYRDRIARAKTHIQAGDVYQVNLTAPLRFRTEGSGAALYAALRQRQAVPYGALLNLPGPDPAGGPTVLSLSPELFVRVDPGDGGRTVTARPMKGTAPRGATPEADDGLVAGLLAAEKDRAENLMIVDLLRNDLARVARGGSVRVPRLFEAERYATLTQMTSTVTADLREGVGLADVLRAAFPCGSVTGAPKRRAVEVLRTLEDGPRGAYCGAIGYAAPGPEGLRSAVFNVAIRTAVLAAGGGGSRASRVRVHPADLSREGRYSVGSGVVWDSEADAEYDECLLKARVLSDLADAPVRLAG
ncbi:MAG TPA: aminodeoxychorismate synthase component I [Rubricoccaceae bacterium]